MSDWQPIETAPKDRSVMLFAPYGLIYCGRKRFGNLGEPQQGEHEWRCDSSGRFANPTHWMPLPPPPTETPKHVMPQFKDVQDMVNALSIRSKE